MLIPKQHGKHPFKPDKLHRKVFIRAFLTQALALSPSQASKLFAPFYNPADVLAYLKEHGYRPAAKKVKQNQAPLPAALQSEAGE